MSEPVAPLRLSHRWPELDPSSLVADLVPPPRFDDERFTTYSPDPGQPSQSHAVQTLEQYAGALAASARGGSLATKQVGSEQVRSEQVGSEQVGSTRVRSRSLLSRLLRGSIRPAAARGIYLDGGFGVGKTHLLASLWHAAPAPKAFGTFVGYTHLVGALGFAATVQALSRHRLVCIDEFELDDPGDTVLMSTLLGRLADGGVSLAATSNTLPGALGEGRFAADDFLREIQALSRRFEVVTIDGEDFRHRGLAPSPPPMTDSEVHRRTQDTGGAVDDFADLVAHLARLHPSRYGALLDNVPSVGWRGVHPVEDQSVALRLVVLADRLYDRDVPVFASGVPLSELFTPELMRGGYRKKYHRAVSRLTALAREAAGEVAHGLG